MYIALLLIKIYVTRVRHLSIRFVHGINQLHILLSISLYVLITLIVLLNVRSFRNKFCLKQEKFFISTHMYGSVFVL